MCQATTLKGFGRDNMLSGILLLLWIVTSIVFLVTLIIFIVEKQRKKQGSINKKVLIIIFAIGIIFLIAGITSGNLNKDSNSSSNNKKTAKEQTVYKVKVDSVKVDDMSNWEIKGTTNAPDGAKMFATYGDKTDSDFFGINAASSKSTIYWSTTRNGRFTMLVDPLTMHYEKAYQGNQAVKAYLFAVTGLKGKLDYYSLNPKINSNLKSTIIDSIKITNLTLSDSQAKYYNNLGSSSSSSSSNSSEESSSSSSSDADTDSSLSPKGTAKDLATGTWSAGKDFDKGYYKIIATGGSGNLSSTNNSDGFDFSAILGTDADNDLGQVTSYTGFILKNTELEISGLQGVHLEPVSPTQEIDITNIPAGDYIVGGSIPAGRYKLSAVQGSGNVTSTGGLNEVIGTQADTDINQVTNTTVTLKSGDILTTGLQQISLSKQ